MNDAERFGTDNDGAAFFGKILLAGALSHTGQAAEALVLVEETMAQGAAANGQPGFVLGMLLGLKGYLIGILGEPEAGLGMLQDGLATLAEHPLASVITPRLGILLAPGAIELLVLLAERGGPDGIGERRARRAATLVNAHDRLRPSAVPPAEADELARSKARLLALLGEDGYAAGYAEGDGLGVDEAVALMRDVD